jgi:hypothetical protein
MMRSQVHSTDSGETSQSSLLDLCDLIDLLAETASPPRDEPLSLTKQRIDARVRQLGEHAARVRRVLQSSDRPHPANTAFPRLAQ